MEAVMAALECYRCDTAALMAHLLSAETLSAYSAFIEADDGSQAEAGQLAFGRRMLSVVAKIGAHGVEGVASQERSALDALLTDCFAVASYQGWDLPVESLGVQEVATEGLQRGLLGAENDAHGAGLFLIDEATIGLRRSRDDEAITLRER